jgi:hypothetical protein
MKAASAPLLALLNGTHPSAGVDLATFNGLVDLHSKLRTTSADVGVRYRSALIFFPSGCPIDAAVRSGNLVIGYRRYAGLPYSRKKTTRRAGWNGFHGDGRFRALAAPLLAVAFVATWLHFLGNLLIILLWLSAGCGPQSA